MYLRKWYAWSEDNTEYFGTGIIYTTSFGPRDLGTLIASLGLRSSWNDVRRYAGRVGWLMSSLRHELDVLTAEHLRWLPVGHSRGRSRCAPATPLSR